MNTAAFRDIGPGEVYEDEVGEITEYLIAQAPAMNTGDGKKSERDSVLHVRQPKTLRGVVSKKMSFKLEGSSFAGACFPRVNGENASRCGAMNCITETGRASGAH